MGLSHAVCLGFPGGELTLSARTRTRMGTIYDSPLIHMVRWSELTQQRHSDLAQLWHCTVVRRLA